MKHDALDLPLLSLLVLPCLSISCTLRQRVEGGISQLAIGRIRNDEEEKRGSDHR